MISQVIVWLSVMPLFISDTHSIPILAEYLITFRWCRLTNDPPRKALNNILLFMCCYQLYYVANSSSEQTKVINVVVFGGPK